MRNLLILSSLLWVGCGPASSSDPCEGKEGTCIGVHVIGNATALDQLVFTIGTQSQAAPAAPAPVSLPVQIAIFPPANASGTITLDLDGKGGGAVIAHDSKMVDLSQSHQQLTMTLDLGSFNDLGPSIVITPPMATVTVGKKQAFLANVAVTWAVMESSNCGAIDGNGVYTAPAAPATCHVVATGIEGGGSATAPVMVVPVQLKLVAGQAGGPGNLDAVGTAARVSNESQEMTSDGSTVYFVDGHSVRAIDRASGKVTTLAGNSQEHGLMDGVGGAARFYFPTGLALDGATNLYVADGINSKIRVIALATGTVTTPALVGTLTRPAGLTFMGGKLYIADSTAHVVRVADLTTMAISNYAGTPNTSGYNDGAAGGALFNAPFDLSNNGINSIFVSERFGERIRTITSIGANVTVGTLAGSGAQGFKDDVGTLAVLNSPAQTVFSAGIVYFQDQQNRVLREIVVGTQAVTTIAGVPMMFGYQDGAAATALFGGANSLAPDGTGGLYMADQGNYVLRRYDLATKIVSTVAGSTYHQGSANGAGAAATFNLPIGVAVDANNVAYVCDESNSIVRKIDLGTGTASLLAGQAAVSGNMNGTGAGAQFDTPSGIVLYDANTLYVADTLNHLIRKVTLPTGTVSTPFGSGAVTSTDGNGNSASFANPYGIGTDHAGFLYIGDGPKLRSINLSTTEVKTIAGSTTGLMEGSFAVAKFSSISGVVAANASTLYLADTGNNAAVWKIDLNAQSASLLAGGTTRGSNDAVGTAATFGIPIGVALDGAGAFLYVADANDVTVSAVMGGTVRKIDLGSKQVTTYVGKGGQHGVAPGPLPASLNSPGGLAFTPAGDLVVTDALESVVLIVQ